MSFERRISDLEAQSKFHDELLRGGVDNDGLVAMMREASGNIRSLHKKFEERNNDAKAVKITVLGAFIAAIASWWSPFK